MLTKFFTSGIPRLPDLCWSSLINKFTREGHPEFKAENIRTEKDSYCFKQTVHWPTNHITSYIKTVAKRIIRNIIITSL